MNMLNNLPARILLLTAIALLAGCASPSVFDREGVDLGARPELSLQNTGQKVIWGGTIIETRNLAEHTRIEVLAYPLSGSLRPELNEMTQGRFLIQRVGYLEPREYAPGRSVTVEGLLVEPQTGRIGEANYRYAVVKADKIKLWDKAGASSRIHFGIGIGIHN